MIKYPFLLISTICTTPVGIWISWKIVATYEDKYGKITINIPLTIFVKMFFLVVVTSLILFNLYMEGVVTFE